MLLSEFIYSVAVSSSEQIKICSSEDSFANRNCTVLTVIVRCIPLLCVFFCSSANKYLALHINQSSRKVVVSGDRRIAIQLIDHKNMS